MLQKGYLCRMENVTKRIVMLQKGISIVTKRIVMLQKGISNVTKKDALLQKGYMCSLL